ncbi:hypothetical protein BKA70DRAFT_1440718 [Coprinopsis sp. MPI-PUGE-AT-0042]|nr:hypothetical protein BKA70DRAFT_1440718 [Coprinopsis sp. MPI-PUGE-AT-0042]
MLPSGVVTAVRGSVLVTSHTTKNALNVRQRRGFGMSNMGTVSVAVVTSQRPDLRPPRIDLRLVYEWDLVVDHTKRREASFVNVFAQWLGKLFQYSSRSRDLIGFDDLDAAQVKRLGVNASGELDSLCAAYNNSGRVQTDADLVLSEILEQLGATVSVSQGLLGPFELINLGRRNKVTQASRVKKCLCWLAIDLADNDDRLWDQVFGQLCTCCVSLHGRKVCALSHFDCVASTINVPLREAPDVTLEQALPYTRVGSDTTIDASVHLRCMLICKPSPKIKAGGLSVEAPQRSHSASSPVHYKQKLVIGRVSLYRESLPCYRPESIIIPKVDGFLANPPGPFQCPGSRISRCRGIETVFTAVMVEDLVSSTSYFASANHLKAFIISDCRGSIARVWCPSCEDMSCCIFQRVAKQQSARRGVVRHDGGRPDLRANKASIEIEAVIDFVIVVVAVDTDVGLVEAKLLPDEAEVGRWPDGLQAHLQPAASLRTSLMFIDVLIGCQRLIGQVGA